MSQDWPTCRWVIDWYGFLVGAHWKKTQFDCKVNYSDESQTLPHVCCTYSGIFCHLSHFVLPKFRRSQAWCRSFYVCFVSSLLKFFLRFFLWISISGDAASFKNSRTLSYGSWAEDKVRTWRHSAVFNFSLSSCSYSFNFLFLSHSYQCACFFTLLVFLISFPSITTKELVVCD